MRKNYGISDAGIKRLAKLRFGINYGTYVENEDNNKISIEFYELVFNEVAEKIDHLIPKNVDLSGKLYEKQTDMYAPPLAMYLSEQCELFRSMVLESDLDLDKIQEALNILPVDISNALADLGVEVQPEELGINTEDFLPLLQYIQED